MTSHWFVVLSYLFVKYFSIYCNEIEDGVLLSFQNPEPIWAPNGPLVYFVLKVNVLNLKMTKLSTGLARHPKLYF